MLRIVYLLICFTLLLGFSPNIESAHAVPKAVKAKSEFMLADKLFNEKNYSGAIEHAEKAKSLLGKSNSRIEYVLTKAYNAQGKYSKALASLEAFFNVTPESRSGSAEYNEMVALYAEVEILAKKQKKQEAVWQNVSAVDLPLGSSMVMVPGGCFQMGSSSGDDDEKPVHRVCLDGYSISKYEVTQALWTAVMGSNPSKFSGSSHPVENVSWDDVQQFLRKLNSKTGGNYRLPTEAEWEFAARSGGKNEKYSGGSNLDRVAWYGSNSGNTTHPVGQKTANGLGLYDMSGNVWEWCQDWYGEKYYRNSASNNPTGSSSGEARVGRGGSWYRKARYLRSAFRNVRSPGYRDDNLGFRLVLP